MNFKAKPLDYKIVLDSDLNSRFLEKKFHLLRMSNDLSCSKLLFGSRPVSNEIGYYNLDNSFKIISKYLSFNENDFFDELIDSNKTLRFNKISYRKLRNLLKTFVELKYEKFRNYPTLVKLNSIFEKRILFSSDDRVFDYKIVKDELLKLLEVYTKDLCLSLSDYSLENYSLDSLDPIWVFEDIINFDCSAKEQAQEIINRTLNHWSKA